MLKRTLINIDIESFMLFTVFLFHIIFKTPAEINNKKKNNQ